MSENSNEFSALGKDINNSLYQADRATRVAQELGYSAVGGMNKMVQDIRQEMLEGNELVLINTGTGINDIEIVDADTALSTGVIDESAVITNEADLNDFLTLQSALEADDVEPDTLATVASFRVSGKEQLKTMLDDKGYDLNENQLGTLNKTLRTATPKISDKAFKFTTGTIKVGAKTGKLTTKAGGKLVRFGRNFNVFDAEGNVDAVQSGANQLKTTAKWGGRNFLAKPMGYLGKKTSQKLMRKPVQAITRGIGKLETKITSKLAKMSAKGISKVLQVLVKVLAHIIKWLVTAIVSCLPFAIVFLVLVIIVVVIMSVFGGNMDDNQLQKYSDYMSQVQTEFQDETQGYYNEGYKVDGTYNGTAYINWQAALSVLQMLQPELDASDSEFDLLDKMTTDGTMYRIEETTTEEYVRKEKDIDASVVSKINNINGTNSVEYTISFRIDDEYTFDSLTVNGKEVSSNSLSVSGNSYSYTFVDYNTETVKNQTAKVHEVIKTTTKYVVTVGTLDDYKNWIDQNTSSIMYFYDAENISYNSNTTSFLTTDLSENIDELYNSDDFTMLFDEAGITMGGGSGGGEIFDTGEHSGVLAYPTTYRNISAGFPKYPSGRDHTGIDFPAPNNTPICACADGVVILSKELNYSYGHYIVIKHNINGQTLYTLYAHNNRLYVKTGDTVKKGQHIADSGSTGNSTGPHCHLSVLTSWSPQRYVQPLDYL